MPGPPVHNMNSQGTGSAIPTGPAAPFQPKLDLQYGRGPEGDVAPPKRNAGRRPKGLDPRTRNAQAPTLF